FFMIAWVIFLASVIIFVLRNFNVLPYNNFTYYALQIGSALEVILLSFALADKINTFRREKEESQLQAMTALEENTRIIAEQNVMLETKVSERTHELKISNQELNKTLQELKEAEMQLVESEKMASLGQLTAGIAHEINNPINFVTSNVKPLKRDVDMLLTMIEQVETITLNDGPLEDKKRKIMELKEEYDFDYLKTEIDHLLKGINEGSSRTAEIVKGLRIFSRLDEDDLKKASINEGIDSTIVIVNNLLDSRITIDRQYGNIPMVECYPGKLNQVFLNIITNGIHAIKSKFKEQAGGKVTITTTNTEDNVAIKIADNGTGMDELTKKRLFEPFFTTKDVGEGTGLGMSIAYNTIKKHNGTITVNSIPGEGTEFIIEIPITQ
ncbi:MAG: histidine kinase, partial [Flavipsychrobacter sp.]|nr:histidine kinase [Flavipsychrobacter sp.]